MMMTMSIYTRIPFSHIKLQDISRQQRALDIHLIYCLQALIAYTIATTSTKNDLFINGPAKSICSLSQGCLGHVQGCSGATGGH